MMVQGNATQADCDVVVVGAGFAGIYAIWKARERGLSVRAFEKASDVGGTWYWNRYPGAKCDVPSYYYAYFFNNDIVRDWEWSDVCAAQPEIHQYLRFVADRGQVREHITFNTSVDSIEYDEHTKLWSLATSGGEQLKCRYVIMAVGALSTPKAPDIEGVDTFQGRSLFTSMWPKDEQVDLTGKRVGVIGTGSSGVQIVPEMAKVAKDVYVFQRTANYVVPTDSGPIDPEKMAELRHDPQEFRAYLRQTYGGNGILGIGQERFHDLDEAGRQKALEDAWNGRYIALAFRDAHLKEANAAISDFIRKKMQEQVSDPATAHHLTPWDHPYGGKRPCKSDTYLQTFNLPHVHLVPLRENPIVRIEPDGIVTQEGKIELDVIIYATGFDAITGAVLSMDVKGLNGVSMRDVWADGPINYLGTMVNGFPNMFFPSSAMSPSVLSNMATLAEQQVDFILDTVEWLGKNNKLGLHPKPESQQFWREETMRYAERRPGALTSNSWYVGANIPNKPRIFMIYCGGFKKYNDTCQQEVEQGFPGYEFVVHEDSPAQPV